MLGLLKLLYYMYVGSCNLRHFSRSFLGRSVHIWVETILPLQLQLLPNKTFQKGSLWVHTKVIIQYVEVTRFNSHDAQIFLLFDDNFVLQRVGSKILVNPPKNCTNNLQMNSRWVRFKVPLICFSLDPKFTQVTLTPLRSHCPLHAFQ